MTLRYSIPEDVDDELHTGTAVIVSGDPDKATLKAMVGSVFEDYVEILVPEDQPGYRDLMVWVLGEDATIGVKKATREDLLA